MEVVSVAVPEASFGSDMVGSVGWIDWCDLGWLILGCFVKGVDRTLVL